MNKKNTPARKTSRAQTSAPARKTSERPPMGRLQREQGATPSFGDKATARPFAGRPGRERGTARDAATSFGDKTTARPFAGRPGRERFAPPTDAQPEEIPMIMPAGKRGPKLDLPGKKTKLAAWVEENRIPGKTQAWLSIPAAPGSGDWRLISETRGAHRMLMLEPPAPGVRPPASILAIDEQLRKEHLKSLRRQLLQVIFRSTGDGRYGILMHAIMRTPEASHALKTWMDFLQRFHPEVLCCHVVQTKPWYPFDPSEPPVAMKYTLKTGFGSEYLPIAQTGFYHHILDWAPRNKSTWLAWPERLRNAIHPVPGDRLLACHCGPALESLALANSFADIHCLDSRQWAHSSWMHNIHAAGISNSSFYQEKFEEKWITDFFAKPNRSGKWTVLLNPPGHELMPAGAVIAIAKAKPERVVLIVGDLDHAGREIKRWRRSGYILRKILPLDWNPDVSHFEMALLFVPDRAGLLGRKPEPLIPLAPVRPREEPKAPALRFVQPKSRARSRKV